MLRFLRGRRLRLPRINERCPQHGAVDLRDRGLLAAPEAHEGREVTRVLIRDAVDVHARVVVVLLDVAEVLEAAREVSRQAGGLSLDEGLRLEARLAKRLRQTKK